MALMADDGLARAISPSHTIGDGDTVFALATGRWPGQASPTIVGALAAEVLAEAIVRAVAQAQALGGLPSARDLGTVPARASGEPSPRRRRASTPLPSSASACGRRASCGRAATSSSPAAASAPGLIFSSMLAANIGAGSTVGASGLAYRDGLSAWWWVGSAGLGSLVFAFSVAPRLWALAKEHDFYTTGDYLEFRYGAAVRGVATALVGLGALALLAGQLIAGAAILNVLTGMPRWAGALIGGGIMTIYFTAGRPARLGVGQHAAARVMLVGLAAGAAVRARCRWAGSATCWSTRPPWSRSIRCTRPGPGSGWTLLALTGPAFIVSPGLIQKAYGARSARAVRIGVALNAVALLLFAFVPGAARHGRRGSALPGIDEPQRGAADAC